MRRSSDLDEPIAAIIHFGQDERLSLLSKTATRGAVVFAQARHAAFPGIAAQGGSLPALQSRARKSLSIRAFRKTLGGPVSWARP